MSKKFAVLFPGQGSQYEKMSEDLLQSDLESREYFKKLFDLVGEEKAQKIVDAKMEDLSKTKYAQLAIFMNSVALYDAFMARYGDRISVQASAGLSLGEYSALYAAGVLDIENGIKLICKRGEIMEAAASGKGSMVAVMKSNVEEISAILEEVRGQTEALIAICNLNSPAQIVVGGEFEALDKFMELCAEKGLKKLVKLDVEGPFHTEVLKEASEEFRQVLEQTPFKTMQIDVYTNYTGETYASKEDLADTLAKQMYSPVYFEKIVRNMIADGIDHFVEIGPGTSLKGFIKKIDKEVTVYNIEKVSDLEAFETHLA